VKYKKSYSSQFMWCFYKPVDLKLGGSENLQRSKSFSEIVSLVNDPAPSSLHAFLLLLNVFPGPKLESWKVY